MAGVESRAPLDTDVAIETPEHIVFRYRLAGPARRLLAYLLDLTICYGAFAAVAALVFLGAAGAAMTTHAVEDTMGAGAGLLLLLLFAVQWLYFALLEGWPGTTPGKAAFGLRVLTAAGRPLGFREAALRNVLRAADALPLAYSAGIVSIAGLVSMSATRRFQRLGDLVAGTIVVVPSRGRAATPIVLLPPAEPSELAQLPDHVRLDADEREAVEMFLRRRATLGRARETELASMIAPGLCARFGLTAVDPSRAIALLYDRAANAERGDGPPSSEAAVSWR
jgi:uncharacterized RDD family membrane protein YckC